MPSIEELTEMTVAFRDARNWEQFHTIKNLLISMNLEAAELLELVQWKDDATVEQEAANEEFKGRLAEECADIFMYLLLICRTAGIDLAEATKMKIKRNSEKYPLEKAYGSAKKYTEL